MKLIFYIRPFSNSKFLENRSRLITSCYRCIHYLGSQDARRWNCSILEYPVQIITDQVTDEMDTKRYCSTYTEDFRKFKKL